MPMTRQSKILVIDDEEIARFTLDALLSLENAEPAEVLGTMPPGSMKTGYRLYFAENGAQGIAQAEAILPDIILLDVMMPDMNGFEVCKRIRSNPLLAEVPVLLITALDDRQSRMAGLQAGADDFISKPFDAFELLTRIQNMARLNRYRLLIEQRQELSRLHSELVIAYDKTIEGWSRAADLRDRETGEHSRRIAEKTVLIASGSGFTNEDLAHIWRGSLLHDIGKLGIPDDILQKPGPLNEEEWRIMRLHPEYAYQWLSEIDYLRPALDIPYCHHEKWDGTGYPRGLKGEQIPIAARLFAVVDVWDALTSDRVYRKAMTASQAMAIITAQSGTHFEPAMVDLFFQRFSEDLRDSKS